MGGNRHDGPGAVSRKYIVGDPDRNFPAVCRIHRIAAGKDAAFFLGEVGPVEIALSPRPFLIVLNLRASFRRSDFFHQLVLRRKYQVRRAVQRIRPGGKHRDLAAVCHTPGDGEGNLGAFGAADPVPLHRKRRFRPVKFGKVFEKTVGIAGDAKEPLPERLALDRRTAAVAESALDLLVGEAGFTGRTPVYGHAALVGEPLPEKLEENPLRPFVVGGVGGIDLPVPVVAEADGVDLPAEIGDRFVRRDARMNAGLDGVIFGGQAERIPSHRMQHRVPLHPFPPGNNIGCRIPFAVAHVEAGARRVGKHIERVKFRF